MKKSTKDIYISYCVSPLYLIHESVTVKASWRDEFCKEYSTLTRTGTDLNCSVCLFVINPCYLSVMPIWSNVWQYLWSEQNLPGFFVPSAIWLSNTGNHIYLCFCSMGCKMRERKAMEQITGGCTSITCINWICKRDVTLLRLFPSLSCHI